MGRTLYDKIWDEHVVHTEEDGTAILYIDRHLVHEVTSPQAFEGLREAGRKVWRISSVVATADHNTPTTGWERGYDGITDPISKEQVTTLDKNIERIRRGRVLPVPVQAPGHRARDRPRAGATLPGMTVVCGDSHTSTHGAFGALAHGIGTSEVEHVMATQTLLAKKAKNLLVKVEGKLAARRARPRTSCWRSSAASAQPAAPATRSSSPAPRSATCQHGRPHDGLQHGDRGRRARRPGRGRREDHRLRQGPAAGADRRRMGPGGRLLEDAAVRPRREVRRGGRARRARRSCRRSPGAPRPRWCWRVDGRVPDPDKEKDAEQARRHRARPDLHGPGAGQAHERHLRRQGVHRLVHQQPHRGHARSRGRGQEAGPEGREERQARDGRAGLRPGEGAGRARRAATRSSRPRASNGASRAARCAWR